MNLYLFILNKQMLSSSQANITYYVILFILVCVSLPVSGYLNTSLKVNPNISMIISAGMVVGLSALTYVTLNKGEGFFFQVTPIKMCDGGPYMYSSDPKKLAFCSQFTPQQLAQYECPVGYTGRPVHWERDTMSNSQWKNDMKLDDTYSYPKVL